MRRWLAIALFGGACAGCADAPVVLAPDVDGYSDAVAELDHAIEATRLLRGDDWTVYGRLAATHLQRARLAGGYDDYDHALEALDGGFAVAPEAGGPRTVRAEVLASLHRLPPAIADADAARSRMLLDDRAAAGLDVLRGTLAWQSGDYPRARALIADAEGSVPTFGGAAAEAHQAWHTLDDATAEAAFDRAEALLVGEAQFPRAWLHLQRGLLDLDRDRPELALDHYLDADAALPGWWLVHEHVAEVLVLTERERQAEAIYLEVVERTDSPEFMDALAGLALDRGDAIEAERWIAAAEDRYADQLARHPEAAAGHALDHWLVHGEPQRTVEIARANVAARPNAEAHGKLAAALLRVGQVDEAATEIDAAMATPWRNLDLLDTAAAVYRAAGRDADADAAARLAASLRR